MRILKSLIVPKNVKGGTVKCKNSKKKTKIENFEKYYSAKKSKRGPLGIFLTFIFVSKYHKNCRRDPEDLSKTFNFFFEKSLTKPKRGGGLKTNTENTKNKNSGSNFPHCRKYLYSFEQQTSAPLVFQIKLSN